MIIPDHGGTDTVWLFGPQAINDLGRILYAGHTAPVDGVGFRPDIVAGVINSHFFIPGVSVVICRYDHDRIITITCQVIDVDLDVEIATGLESETIRSCGEGLSASFIQGIVQRGNT